MYKCVKSFSLELVDGDGFILEDEQIIIPEGSIWYVPEEADYRFIGGEIRLESDEFGWIEMSIDTLKGNFELIK